MYGRRAGGDGGLEGGRGVEDVRSEGGGDVHVRAVGRAAVAWHVDCAGRVVVLIADDVVECFYAFGVESGCKVRG